MITSHRISLLVASILLPCTVSFLPNSFPPGRKNKMVDTVLLKVWYYLSNPFFFCLINNLQSPTCHTCKLSHFLPCQQTERHFITSPTVSHSFLHHTKHLKASFSSHQQYQPLPTSPKPLNCFFTPPATLFYPVISFGSV